MGDLDELFSFSANITLTKALLWSDESVLEALRSLTAPAKCRVVMSSLSSAYRGGGIVESIGSYRERIFDPHTLQLRNIHAVLSVLQKNMDLEMDLTQPHLHWWKSLCNLLHPGTLEAFLREVQGNEFLSKFFLFNVPRMIDYLWYQFLTKGNQSSVGGFSRPRNSTTRPRQSREAAILRVSSLDDLDNNHNLLDLWRKTEVLVKFWRDCKHFGQAKSESASPGQANSTGGMLVVHLLAQIDCHPLVLCFALKLYPSQLRQHDGRGWLPLHHAVVGHSTYKRQEQDESMYYLDLTRIVSAENAYTMLLGLYPEAARCVDIDGQLPLMVALKLNPARTMNRLLEITPQALVTRDPVTRLYPYQIAAMKRRSLKTIYGLLRNNPEAMGLRNRSILEQVDDRRLAELQATREVLQATQEELASAKQELASAKVVIEAKDKEIASKDNKYALLEAENKRLKAALESNGGGGMDRPEATNGGFKKARLA